MKILVLNSGSSSIKYQLFEMPQEKVLAQGLIERIGEEGSPIPTHTAGIQHILATLTEGKQPVLKSLDELDSVGHRVVHGGEAFHAPTPISQEVIDTIRECAKLAPLHNPPNLAGIEAISEVLPNIPQVAVFDTAFHQTMPEHAYLYAIPYEMYEKYGIRRYGFHGTSHQYVAQQAAEELGKDLQDLKLITVHLGNGCSVAAIKHGVSIDTSMGLTPLEGLMMGTRSGDIDPAIIPFVMRAEKLAQNEIDHVLNKKSGLLGVSGVSNDVRTLLEEADNGNKRAQLALTMFAYRVRKYLGAYSFAMGGVDAIVFTGGIGQHANTLRDEILDGVFDVLSKRKTKVLVIPTNEELMIAKQAYGLVSAA